MKIIKPDKHFLLAGLIFTAVVVLLAPLVVMATYELAYRGQVYPGINIDSKKLRANSEKLIKITTGELEWEVKAEELGVEVDWPVTQRKLYNVGRTGDFITDIKDKITAYRAGVMVEPVMAYDQTLVEELVASVSAVVDVPAVEPKFKLINGRVTEFQQGEAGRMIDQQLLTESIVEAVFSRAPRSIVQVPVILVEPSVRSEQMTAEELGIIKLLGQGISTFKGSVASREHNILLTTQRLDGILILPGSEFSFNNAIGDVSIETGFKQAYIIREGRTVLDDGGGVCQVSTTLFRAILEAGLPVIERRAHSYRVGYYEQNSPPGFDATVFAPRTDLRFKNDTPGHLLIQTKGNEATDRLVIEIWGTGDGRVVTTTKPVVWDQTPPPEDLYQDDLSLPAGTVKQVDWKAWGAKVKFDYVVTRGGETLIQETFYSNYQPWQAVFLRGTGGG